MNTIYIHNYSSAQFIFIIFSSFCQEFHYEESIFHLHEKRFSGKFHKKNVYQEKKNFHENFLRKFFIKNFSWNNFKRKFRMKVFIWKDFNFSLRKLRESLPCFWGIFILWISKLTNHGTIFHLRISYYFEKWFNSSSNVIFILIKVKIHH